MADQMVLKKRLSTFMGPKGNLSGVSDELLIDILRAWESWTRPSKEFYQSLGINKQQLSRVIGKGKMLSKSGRFPESEFKEIKLEAVPSSNLGPCQGAEVVWSDGKLIRFSDANLLLDFLKKAA